jgi:hypothetical protein
VRKLSGLSRIQQPPQIPEITIRSIIGANPGIKVGVHYAKLVGTGVFRFEVILT